VTPIVFTIGGAIAFGLWGAVIAANALRKARENTPGDDSDRVHFMGYVCDFPDDEVHGDVPAMPATFSDRTITDLPTPTARAGILRGLGAAGAAFAPPGTDGAGGNPSGTPFHGGRV